MEKKESFDLKKNRNSEYIFNIENTTFSVFVESLNEKPPKNEDASRLLHFHHYFELYCLKKGTLYIEFEDITRSLSEGEIICISPGVLHAGKFPEGIDLYVLNFAFKKNNLKTRNDLYEQVTKLFSKPITHFYACESVNNIIAPVVDMCYSGLPLSLYKIAQNFFRIIDMLLDISALQPKISLDTSMTDTNISRLSTISRMIQSYYKENITSKDIGEALFLSPRQIDRIVSQYYGCTLHQRITHLKMKSASKQLLTTDKSIAEISQDIGYRSINTFYSAFKKHFGCLPGDYREKVL